MSKKDFQRIATTIKGLELGDSTETYIAVMFADTLAKDNPRFNREQFIKAAARKGDDPLFVAQVSSDADPRRARLQEALNA